MNQAGIGDFDGAYQCLNNKDIVWSIFARRHPNDSFIPDLDTLNFMLDHFHYVKAH
jgi:hypothetical protein